MWAGISYTGASARRGLTWGRVHLYHLCLKSKWNNTVQNIDTWLSHSCIPVLPTDARAMPYKPPSLHSQTTPSGLWGTNGVQRRNGLFGRPRLGVSPPVTTSVEILIVYHQTDTVHWQIMPLYNVNNLPFERHANESMTFDRYVWKRNDDALVIPVRCCELTTRSTKVGYLMYLGNSNSLLLVLILSCCEEESMLLV